MFFKPIFGRGNDLKQQSLALNALCDNSERDELCSRRRILQQSCMLSLLATSWAHQARAEQRKSSIFKNLELISTITPDRVKEAYDVYAGKHPP
jgi:hypothetical protein